jgi:apolipoprotein D and lipocalin family protein
MKAGWLRIIGAVALAAAAGSAPAQAPEVRKGDAVELQYVRYEGRYYEIAKLPSFPERNCAADVVMTFLKRIEGGVSVIYQCFEQDKSWMMDIGLLDVQHGDEYPGELYFRPDLIGAGPWQWGTYNLIELAGDYSYAMFGAPDRSRLWILSRTRKMADATYRRLVARAAERGYDTAKLLRTVQKGL